MKYTIIGHFSIDVRHTIGGTGAEHGVESEQRSFAGILNAVKTMAALVAVTDTVYPVFAVGEREYDTVKTALAQYATIDTSGIFASREESNEVHYFPSGAGSVVCAKKISAPIPFPKIEPFLNVNGVLINMISGADITIDTLDEIRMAVRSKATPIHLDIHNLTLGLKVDRTRFRRPLADWRRWCFMITTVQMNAEEASGLTNEYTDADQLVKQMVPLMVQSLCVTNGEKGAMVYESQHKSAIAHTIRDEPASMPKGCENARVAVDEIGGGVENAHAPVDAIGGGVENAHAPVDAIGGGDECVRAAVDTIGSGDIFGAAFLHRYCTIKNFAVAGRFAHSIASASVQASGEEKFSVITRLREKS